MRDSEDFCKKGYAIVDFKDTESIVAIQNTIQSIFLSDPVEFHCKNRDDQARLKMIKQAKDSLIHSGYVKNLLLANTEYFTMLLGPDVDIQSEIYLRVSRPNAEGDLIDWHRDTFYGNTPWELNFWFPVFELEAGAGLMLVEGSHLLPVNNIQYVEEKNAFRKQVTKGSLASELGFQYAPKCDDTIMNMDMSKVRLLSPKVGQAIFFFGHAVHRAQNFSNKTRVSIDVRIKHMLAPTTTKTGYYQPLLRSDIARCVDQIYAINEGVLCGN